MKKIIILSAAFALSLSIASCRKVRTCSCTTSGSTVTFKDYSDNLIPDETDTDTWSSSVILTTDKMKKKDAKRKYECYGSTDTDTRVSTGGSGSGSYTRTETTTTTETCELK